MFCAVYWCVLRARESERKSCLRTQKVSATTDLLLGEIFASSSWVLLSTMVPFVPRRFSVKVVLRPGQVSRPSHCSPPGAS